ncbi:DNA-binding protein [Candidatus Microgenomates bacterium]|nr:MAG: DNA-binding protein [Candidatus Microgenomates bacterium]
MKSKSLTKLDSSVLDRRNILNNPFAVEHVQKEVGLKGYKFEGEYRYTVEQVVSFFEIDLRTIRRYISKYSSELEENGYEVLTGDRLISFKNQFASDINVTRKTRNLGLFNFKAFLNLGMLLKESEKARILRGLILDIVIDVVSKKAGGNTKYINQRDDDFLISLYVAKNYRKEFLEALKRYIDIGNIKYLIYTDKIYYSIFKEKANEYKNILNLTKTDNVRDTFYSEILTTVSMYETGLAHEIKKLSDNKKRKLTSKEADELFNEFENNPTLKPQIERARMKMSSRDYALRDIIHSQLTDYIQPLDTAEFERFLGEKSKELAKRIKEYQDVFKRLKDK